MNRICKTLVAVGGAVAVAGCQSTNPVFESRKPEAITIAGYPFEKKVAHDTFGSGWKLVEVHPKVLPYSGEIAKMTAQDRWIEVFKTLHDSVALECRGFSIDGKPSYRADENDFAKMGSSLETPKFGQVKFKCK